MTKVEMTKEKNQEEDDDEDEEEQGEKEAICKKKEEAIFLKSLRGEFSFVDHIGPRIGNDRNSIVNHSRSITMTL